MLRLPWEEQLAAVCRQLRSRDAFWRADPPIHDTTPGTPLLAAAGS